jgi:hypothetical protein
MKSKTWYYIVSGAGGFALMVGVDLAGAMLSAVLAMGLTWLLYACKLGDVFARVFNPKIAGWLIVVCAVAKVGLLHIRYLLGMSH